jgi:hypothetical protein
MYLDNVEANPIAEIVYVSHTMADYDDTLVLVGSARDGDHIDGLPLEDIESVLWVDTFDGTEYDQRQWIIPANSLQPGWHEFTFSAKDKRGNKSPDVSVTVWIAEEFHHLYLPAITQE